MRKKLTIITSRTDIIEGDENAFLSFPPPHQRNKQWGGGEATSSLERCDIFFLFFPRREEDAPVWCTDVLAVSSTVEMEMKMFVCLLLVRGRGGEKEIVGKQSF